MLFSAINFSKLGLTELPNLVGPKSYAKNTIQFTCFKKKKIY